MLAASGFSLLQQQPLRTIQITHSSLILPCIAAYLVRRPVQRAFLAWAIPQKSSTHGRRTYDPGTAQAGVGFMYMYSVQCRPVFEMGKRGRRYCGVGCCPSPSAAHSNSDGECLRAWVVVVRPKSSPTQSPPQRLSSWIIFVRSGQSLIFTTCDRVIAPVRVCPDAHRFTRMAFSGSDKKALVYSIEKTPSKAVA